jgi:uncharacterized protein (TIGR02118 family)
MAAQTADPGGDMPMSDPQPESRLRCVALLSAPDPASAADLQAAWLAQDPVQAAVAGRADAYLQTLPLASEQRGFSPREVFGVAQFWTADLTTALELCAEISAAGFTARSPGLATASIAATPMREYVLVDGPERRGAPDGVKAFFYAKRKPGMSVADFQRHWLHVHGPLVPGTPGVERYVQLHPCPEAYERSLAPYESLAEMTFADAAALAAFNGPSEPRDRQSADLPNLWDLTVRTPRFYVADRGGAMAAAEAR